ncbi:type II toxin-antitoxin system HicA family toxin [Eggerthella sinensis]|uniref:type II toxin-antitoxin system HicA family toxin n=1 Tax=Eggerthella sinensis TaxID=242230 RepID=UPI00248D925D|nr:type II toxin-antitoxin system HicA family toxin [Eggerthella sinensis]
MPPKPFEVYRRLRREGWIDEGGAGSHRKMSRNGKTIVIALHRKELRKGIWERIRKDAGWS